MADTRDVREEIRSRVDILEVISEHVTLKRVGRNYMGLCPFHTEKTPSFSVSQEYQAYHCFGCGEHGDVFSFVMKVDGLTFPEALEKLAKRAGVDISRLQTQQFSQKDQLVRINALAASYYRELLRRVQTPMSYLKERGFADETIQEFRLGYAAPAWDGLTSFLTKKGINPADAARAGLLIKSERGDGYYDRFRNRIMFPILDIHEQVIGFGGRALSNEDQPKYLNSPETPLFNKTRALYGLHLARKKIAEADQAIVVEGYTDAIACHQAGFRNCVATLGTSLTREHISILSRFTKHIVLAYDADSAGVTAALRAASMFEEAGCDVRIARLPGGDDPDSMLTKGLTAEFAAAISQALPIVDYQLVTLIEKSDTTTPEGRADMLKAATRILAGIPSQIEREKYIRALARYHPNFETGTTKAEDHLRKDIDLIARRHQRNHIRDTSSGKQTTRRTALEKAELSILRALIRGEASATNITQELRPEDFSTEITKSAAEIVYGELEQKGTVSLTSLLENARDEVGQLLASITMQEEWEPITEKFLSGCVALVKRSKAKRLRTSDVLSPYRKGEILDIEEMLKKQGQRQMEQYLRETGKLPPVGEQEE